MSEKQKITRSRTEAHNEKIAESLSGKKAKITIVRYPDDWETNKQNYTIYE